MDLPMNVFLVGIKLITFGLFLLGGHDEMSIHHSSLQLIGETVTVSYVADPAVGYGQFRLKNHGTVDVIAAVQSVWLEIGEQRQTFAEVTVFDLEQDQMVNPQAFTVHASKELAFMVGFPRVNYEPSFGELSGVGLQLKVNDDELQALSPIRFERRIPYSQ